MARSFQFQSLVTCGVLAIGMLAAQDRAAYSQGVGGQPAGPQRPNQQPIGPVQAGPVQSGPAQPVQGPQRPLPGQQQPAGSTQPQQGPPMAAVPAAPQAPEWYPLSPEHDKYLNQVLMFWEKSSAKVERYRCNFSRFTYDPTFTPRDPKTGELPAKTISSGEIKYAAPDKGLFREDKIEHYEKGKLQELKGEKGDHWVCDGKSIFLFDYPKKQLMQTELPPEMQGKAIVDGPLPFMFGAEAAKVKDRFWVRVITPPETKGEYWLEAIPKHREDAANFKMIRIIIDILESGPEKTKYSLPKAMAIYDRSPSSQSFSFEKREVNWSTLTEKLNPFAKEFYEPSTPPGFKKVVERAPASGPAPKMANANAKVGGTQPANANGTNGRPGTDPTLYYSKEKEKR